MAKISVKPVKKVAKAITPKTPKTVDAVERVEKTEVHFTPTAVNVSEIIMEKVRKVCENNKMEGKQYSISPEEVEAILNSVL